MKGVIKNLRLESAAGIGENADMAWQIVVHFHEAQSDEAVEPGVGHFFHDLVVAFDFDLLHKGSALVLLLAREGAAIYGNGVLLAITFCCDTVLIGPLGYLRDHLRTRPNGEFLYCVFVHDAFLSCRYPICTPSPSAMAL